jgi:Domain of unknown function (DUF4412)
VLKVAIYHPRKITLFRGYSICAVKNSFVYLNTSGNTQKRVSMKKIGVCLAIGLIEAATPQSSGAQVLKNMVNNMNQSKPKPSISPADSAAAIKSFMTGTGGSGFLYQYSLHYSIAAKKKDSAVRDTMSLSITDGHNIRTDMSLLGSKIQMLGHAGMPRYTVTVYPSTKTYIFKIIDTAALNSADANIYKVTKVGNESVQGYNCVHSKLTRSRPGEKMAITEDIWTCADVPGYSALKKMISVQNVTPKMMEALEQAGCGGFFIKMTAAGSGFSMEMLLIGAGRTNFPDPMFRIPEGYTLDNTANPFARGMQSH